MSYTALLAAYASSPSMAVPPPDETPPTTPPSFTATVVSATQIDLAWGASTDNKGVTGYRLQRCQPGSCQPSISRPTSPRTYSSTGLSSGITYTYYLAAYDAAGNESDTAIRSATTPDNVPPSTPGGLSASAVSGSQINLSWSASSDNIGVSGYAIEFCSGSGCGSFSSLTTTTSTSYSATGLSSAVSYTFRVRSYDAIPLYSGYSNSASATTNDVVAPSAPASMNATAASGTQINLSWAAASDNVGVAAYDVEYCQGSGCSNFVALTSVAATGHNATGLTSATPYRFRVRARDIVPNYGGYSPIASATTLDSVAPSIPGSLQAAAISHARIDLSWIGSTDNVAVTGYRVERCQGSGCTNYAQISTPTGTSFSDTTVSESTSYRYRVSARDAVPNWSSPSNIASANTPAAPDTQAPTAPTGLNATAASSAQVNLAWTAATDNVGVTGYAVQRCQGSSCTDFSQIATPSGTSFSDSGRSPSTTYRYRVLARDAVPNWGSPSNIASVTTPALPDTQAPSTPTGLQLTPGPNQVALSWTASTDNVAVIEYRIERCVVSSGCSTYTDIGGTAATNYTDITATGLITYRFRVRARDAVPNYSPYSSTADALAAACD